MRKMGQKYSMFFLSYHVPYHKSWVRRGPVDIFFFLIHYATVPF